MNCTKVSKQEAVFLEEILAGLSMPHKQLPSKYFYDAIGDKLFQDIMGSEEYYLTRCEMEILTKQIKEIGDSLRPFEPFELIELGPGDCAKSIHLLKYLSETGNEFNYIPIDISSNIIDQLESSLPLSVPCIRVNGLNGEYFEMLRKLEKNPGIRRVVLFLGANIGNMSVEDAFSFCRELRELLISGDLVIFGFDLVKNPNIIRKAYSDREGLTKQFNLNLLTRMNRELLSDFQIEDFEHYCNYDPESGSCKSYLICKRDLVVHFPARSIRFRRDEYIWMEISQKYTRQQIDEMAMLTGFNKYKSFTDSKNWFTDTIWVVR